MMSDHIVDIQTQMQHDTSGNPTGCFRYRWRCSCGCRPGRWYTGGGDSGHHAASAANARRCGEQHVHAMHRAAYLAEKRAQNGAIGHVSAMEHAR